MGVFLTFAVKAVKTLLSAVSVEKWAGCEQLHILLHILSMWNLHSSCNYRESRFGDPIYSYGEAFCVPQLVPKPFQWTLMWKWLSFHEILGELNSVFPPCSHKVFLNSPKQTSGTYKEPQPWSVRGGPRALLSTTCAPCWRQWWS